MAKKHRKLHSRRHHRNPALKASSKRLKKAFNKFVSDLSHPISG